MGRRHAAAATLLLFGQAAADDGLPTPVAGVDEAGRGPLAGPVAVAAVVLDPARPIEGLNDSKQLSEARRDALYPQIIERAAAFHIVLVSAAQIDRLNILQATFHGMREAVAGVAHVARSARIDGNKVPPGLCLPGQFLIGGDGKDAAIAAASILAKVTRDRYMLQLHQRLPHYGFDRHKGYGTAAHLAALAAHGPCPEHRHSFAPVRVAAAARAEVG
ncbi:ribonuclease HII [Stenotrophomonas ginsengisoli]|uniref:Ribonuclease HII n=1 Tax=Stenotrophomonas ginsengisoli TaxID=336566 RepID=A0A0R0D6T4_9GAMM|nr:ribonuclease HII [Stenotrophomonas ginsengisoli]KRG77371.1 ribonuclease HII [Stenotrophomonas ginsengisoli]